MNKYYVCTPFWRSLADNRKAFVEAETGAKAANMVLGGEWKRSKFTPAYYNTLEGFATVYKLRRFELLPDGRIDAERKMRYERVQEAQA